MKSVDPAVPQRRVVARGRERPGIRQVDVDVDELGELLRQQPLAAVGTSVLGEAHAFGREDVVGIVRAVDVGPPEGRRDGASRLEHTMSVRQGRPCEVGPHGDRMTSDQPCEFAVGGPGPGGNGRDGIRQRLPGRVSDPGGGLC